MGIKMGAKHMRNIKLIVEYDGTNYCGWQIQKNRISVQEELSRAIKKITNEECEVIGSGRTDAGVHAKGQVANFHTSSRIPEEKFAFALNAVLPCDIVIKSSKEAPADFHSRFSAKGKVYSYKIFNSRFPSAIFRNYAYHVCHCEKLDIEKMKLATKYLTGTHDFRGFMSTGSSIKDTVRTIYNIEILQEGEFLELKFHGNGFLYNMVRILTGTLIYVGIDKIRLEELPGIIEQKDRTRAGLTAPAHGLYLEKVDY